MILESDDCRQIYNVGSGAAHSLQEMLDYIISLNRQKITVETDPARFRPVDTPVICCDAGQIRKKLGWSPQYDIFDTLKEIYEYYLAH
jgi:GDP-4-dehydro-6-deoxy-D-mannose reductase